MFMSGRRIRRRGAYPGWRQLICIFLIVMVGWVGGCQFGIADEQNITVSKGTDIFPVETTVVSLETASPIEREPTPSNEQIGRQVKTQIRPIDGMSMVYIPAGSFQMGSNREDLSSILESCNQYPDAHCYPNFFQHEIPQHKVTLDSFWIDQTEVTNSQYRQCVRAGACQPPVECGSGELSTPLTYSDATQSDHPVVCVNWRQAVAYCEWAGGDLPSEAQWEYAARGPDSLSFPWGNEFDGARLNYCASNCKNAWSDVTVDDGYAYTAPVGSYPDGASWCGALDLAGNVFEWVKDWDGKYSTADDLNPSGPDNGSEKGLRGGAWYYDPSRARAATRDKASPEKRFGFLGFRCAMPGNQEAVFSVPATPTAQPAPVNVDQALKRLKGLSLDDFFEESYKQLLLRSPQKVTALGLADKYGIHNDRLDDLSDAYQSETRRLETAILELLRAYDRENLSPEQQINYEVYEWYLDMRVQGHRFAYHDYPLHHFLDSYQFLTDQLFTEFQPLEDKRDAEDYVARLSLVDRQVDQLLEGLRIREQMGVIPPDFIIYLTRKDLYQRLGMLSNDRTMVEAAGLDVYSHFQDKVLKMRIGDVEKADLLVAARQQIEFSYIPAYFKLLDYLDEIEPKASDDAGVWKLPDGEAYYAWKLHWETSTDITAEQVYEIGLQEVDRLKGEMLEALKALRYPAQLLSPSQMLVLALGEAGYYDTDSSLGKAQVVAAYEELLEEIELKMQPAFDLYPSMDVIIYGDESFSGGGGFYVPGALDGSRPGAFHAGVGGGYVYKMSMPTTLFHEAVPGHHFQIALSYDLDLPTFRKDILLNGYAEGWALYAEQLAWELGMYENDLYGNVGRLQFELLRAARLVADTGIHVKHWSRNEARSYMDRVMGGSSQEVDRYVVFPAQATGYKIGMLKILELRQMAQDELGEDFDMAEFHRVVLGHGGLPLEILERVVKEYIQDKKK
jgi:uncharacterized protein (DUF885 family)/formylglycine-generating enzyme required for sulfatase activity